MIHPPTNQALLPASAGHSNMIALPQLYYNHSSGRRPLPYWGQFFLQVGANVATHPKNSARLIVGCAIPTKAYAATLATAGAVISLAFAHRFTPDDIVSRAEWLQLLEPGTPLIYRRERNTLQKGVLEGWQFDKGVQFARIKTQQAGNEFIILPPTALLGVDQLADPSFTLPRKRLSRRIVDDAELAFLSSCLSTMVAHEYVAYSRLDCLIIGSKEQFRREARDIPFLVEDAKQSFVEGTLNMLTRTRDILTDSSAYRSDLLASAGAQDVMSPNTISPTVVIFSGATGFLKWRDLYRSSHWVVLLDRTELHFQEAVWELNQEYVQRRVEEEPLSLPLTPPSRIETILYHEAL